MKAEEVCDNIEKNFEKRFSDGVGNYFELETNCEKQKTVYVEELHCHVLKGKNTYRCDYDNKQSIEVFTRIDLLLRLIYILLKIDMTANIRSIQYSYKETFANTIAVQKVFERICKAIGCDKDSLNIFVSVKGSIVGDIEFKFTKGETIYTTNCQKAIRIEPRDVAMELEFVKLTKKELLLILVVEKDKIFQRLVEEKFHHRFRCIIITGCRVPTIATRTLLHKAQKQLNFLVVFLRDQNGGGFKVCSNYYCGSQDMVYNSINLCTPNIKLLGLSPSDLEEHGTPAGSEPMRGLKTIKQLNLVY
ncbi:PREDICTED: DNA topoisomerase 6 subunit A-like [Fragaria vesca subsp. vesca]|uniref:DNA topoisomerase 6 subunit A-like n=1 Tax=Fragaria vesca subsp. vesca TaxID=101020 RepID=UPI0002C33742|nr:PREDICTED: DNA topoisomerase 6 subunit A-like [Fragaria vesca subsp. vesca]